MSNRLLEGKDYATVYTYKMSRKNGSLTEEKKQHLLQEIRTLLFFKLQKLYKDQKTQEIFQFREDCEKGDFSSLSEISSEQTKISIDKKAFEEKSWNCFRAEIQPLVNTCGILVGDLPEAANIITLFVTASTRFQTQLYSLLEAASCYGNGKEEKGPFEVFYENQIPFSIICKIGLADYGICNLLQSSIGEQGYNLANRFIEFIKNHRQEAEEQLKCGKIEDENLIYYMEILYKLIEGTREDYLIPFLSKKSKVITGYVEELLRTRQTEEVREKVEAIVAAGKPKGAVDIAIRLIREWDKKKIEKEIQALTTEEEFISYIESKYGRNNEKNVPYAEKIDFSQVRFKTSENLIPSIVLKFYLSEYINLKELYPVEFCEKIAEWFNPYDLSELLQQVYGEWILNGVEAKFRNILLPYALHSGSAKLEELKKQAGEWIENGKPSLALLTTKSIALNGSKEALLMVDMMSKKHKNKRIRKASLEALEFAREKFGLSKEEMEDRMVPDLGFQNGKRIFSYGNRSFEARLLPDLSIELYDGKKKIKSLPKASEKFGDEEQKVEEAKGELKVIKKQIKLIIEAQKIRMEGAIYSGRKWPKERWISLFLENPFLLSFATGLIWEELDERNNILGTFRYMEDGSFNTKEEEEHKLSENTFIRLLHPSDITEEEVEEWREQLEDYEIIQPISQLSLPVLRIKEGEEEKEALCDIEGCKVYGPTIKSIATKMFCELSYTDWECNGFSYEFPNEDLILTLNCEPFDAGDYTTVVKLKKIQFLRNDDKRTPFKLIEIPGRILSLGKKIENMLLAKEVKNEEERKEK